MTALDHKHFNHRASFAVNLRNLLPMVEVQIANHKTGRLATFDAIIDTGCTFVHVPAGLFDRLGYDKTVGAAVTVRGINQNSGGFSCLVDDFAIGGLSLGKTRVTVSNPNESLRDVVIVGMSVLSWFNLAFDFTNATMTLAERGVAHMKGAAPFERFTMLRSERAAVQGLPASL